MKIHKREEIVGSALLRTTVMLDYAVFNCDNKYCKYVYFNTENDYTKIIFFEIKNKKKLYLDNLNDWIKYGDAGAARINVHSIKESYDEIKNISPYISMEIKLINGDIYTSEILEYSKDEFINAIENKLQEGFEKLEKIKKSLKSL